MENCFNSHFIERDVIFHQKLHQVVITTTGTFVYNDDDDLFGQTALVLIRLLLFALPSASFERMASEIITLYCWSFSIITAIYPVSEFFRVLRLGCNWRKHVHATEKCRKYPLSKYENSSNWHQDSSHRIWYSVQEDWHGLHGSSIA